MKKKSPWAEKYRPKKLEDLICDDDLGETLQGWISNGIECPHILLVGSPGRGKTSLAQVLINELDAEFIKLNAADERGIEVVRERIKRFAMVLGLKGKEIKIILLDEAEYLTDEAQAALRGMMERFFRKTKFILTCNSFRKIDEALQSRCEVIRMERPPWDSIMNRAMKILDAENIDYDVDDVRKLVDKGYPDIRSIIRSLQTNSKKGKLVVG